MSLKFKRHYKLIAMLVLLSAALILGFGNRPMIAYTIDDSSFLTGGTASQVVEASTASGNSVSLTDDTTAPTFPSPSYQAN